MLSRTVEEILSAALDSQGRAFGPGERGVAQIGSGLKDVLAKSRIFLYGAGGMCVILFFVYIILIIHDHQDTTKLVALSSAFGISIAGLIATMMRMADRQVQSGMLLALISGLPQDEILPAFKALLDHDRRMKGLKSKTS